MYFSIFCKDLPSRNLAYDNINCIKYREMTFKEVMNFSKFRKRKLDLLEFIKEREIVKGIDIYEITVGDWQFIELSLVNTSFAGVSYPYDLGDCSNCEKELKEQYKEEDLYISIGNVKKSKIPKMIKILAATDILFNDIEDTEIQLPISVTLDNGNEAPFDFYRLKHLIKMEEQDDRTIQNRISIISGIDLYDMSMDDYHVFVELSNLLSHGLDNKIEISCPRCGKTINKKIDWRLLRFFPYVRDGSSFKERITFGKNRKNISDRQNTLSRDIGTIESA